MRAPNIKHSIDMTKDFMELWLRFNQMYKDAMGKPSISQEEEKAFLDTKSIVARKFQTLADSLSLDRSIIDRAYEVVSQILSLKSISTLSEHALRKIDNDWHESYISLNRLLGHLEAQKEDSSARGEGIAARLSKSIGKPILYFVVVFTFVLVILFLAYILGLIK